MIFLRCYNREILKEFITYGYQRKKWQTIHNGTADNTRYLFLYSGWLLDCSFWIIPFTMDFIILKNTLAFLRILCIPSGINLEEAYKMNYVNYRQTIREIRLVGLTWCGTFIFHITLISTSTLHLLKSVWLAHCRKPGKRNEHELIYMK